MANQDITTLIAGLQIEDPKLYQALMLLNERMLTVENDLFPLVRQSEDQELADVPPVAPTGFIYELTPLTVRMKWNQVEGAPRYEIREGTEWDTGFFAVRTTSQQADLPPMLEGTHYFMLKSISAGGLYSLDMTTLTVVIPVGGAPSVTAQVIDNNVLLNWTVPSSAFAIDYYILRRGESEIGRLKGNFTVWFEMIGGVYTYSVQAFDVAGNAGGIGIVSATLTTPPDFILEAVRVSTLGAYTSGPPHYVYLQLLASFGDVNYQYAPRPGFEVADPHFYFAELTVSSTLYQVVRMPGPKLLCCWAIQDWQTHFTSRSWLDPKDQVDAGYPIYIQPGVLTGYYEETYDYGAVFNNNIVTVSWTEQPLTSYGMTTVVRMAVSLDGVTYTPYVEGASQFYESIRFMKLKLEFTLENDKAIHEVFQLTISLSVKKELDSGIVDALASDYYGTQVFFNKAFKDVDSITLAVESKEPVTAIYDFLDQPNPTYFRVFALDSSGNRVSYPMSWKARGII